MQMSKTQIRKEVLKLREGLSDAERNKARFLITERIIGHQWFYLSDTILGFASYGSEIDVYWILEEALKKGKKVFLPKVCGEDMVFYRVDSLEDLVPGYKGIPEPKGEQGGAPFERYSPQKYPVESSLLLMPGVAFDGTRNRIGYGKGFYDRFLEKYPDFLTRSIALGFQCQMVEEIPEDPFDKKPYQIICV